MFRDVVTQALSIKLNSKFYVRGQTASIVIKGLPNENVTLSVTNPLSALVLNRSIMLNAVGLSTQSMTVFQGARSGTYRIKLSSPSRVSDIHSSFSVLETTGFNVVSLPFTRIHLDTKYVISSQGINVTLNDDNLFLSYPDLPSSVTVTNVANNMTFVHRLRNVQTGIRIDVVYLFIHDGVKILINGTVPSPTIISFKVASLKNLIERFDSLSNGDLFFDWTDIRVSGLNFNYDREARTIQINISGSFYVDPYISTIGFETNDFSEFSSTGGSPDIVTSPVHHGSYAMRANASGEWAQRSFTAQATTYTKFETRFTVFPGNFNDTQVVAIYNSTGFILAAVNIRNQNGLVLKMISYYPSSSTQTYSYAFSTNTWYTIEVRTTISATVGTYEVYLDDSLVINRTNVDSSAGVNTAYVRLGTDAYGGGTGQVYFDCFVVDNAFIGQESGPSIGEFQASSTVYANQYVFLNATIKSGTTSSTPRLDLKNATIEITGNVVLQWINSTNVFSENADVNNYATLDAVTSVSATVNATSIKLSWYVKLNTMSAGAKSVVVTNTKVFDSGGFSGSGSQANLFTFSYITLTLQARDATSTNLPRQVGFNGTMGNGTSFDVTSNANGNYALTTTYGSTTVYTWWGTHLVQTSTPSVTADATLNVDSKIRRFNVGDNYLLFSLNNTELLVPELIGSYNWRIVGVTATGNIQFKMDSANWVKLVAPYSFTFGGTTYTSGTGSWSYASNIFTFTCSFSTQTLSMSWDFPEGGGGGGSGGGYTPPVVPPIVPVPTEVLPPISGLLPGVISEPTILSGGLIAIVVVIAGAIGYGEFTRKKPTPRNVWKTGKVGGKVLAEVKWSKTPKIKIDWRKKQTKTQTKWKRKKSFD